MTYQEITTMLNDTNMLVTYEAWPLGHAPALPYIVYYYDTSDDFIADNENYQKIEHLVIELYTETKDFTAEATLESALKAHHLVYSRTETYINDELMYMERYESEVIIS